MEETLNMERQIQEETIRTLYEDKSRYEDIIRKIEKENGILIKVSILSICYKDGFIF